jgi:hypothetical protein
MLSRGDFYADTVVLLPWIALVALAAGLAAFRMRSTAGRAVLVTIAAAFALFWVVSPPRWWVWHPRESAPQEELPP